MDVGVFGCWLPILLMALVGGCRFVVVDVVEPAAVCLSARLVDLFVLRSATIALLLVIQRH